MPCRRADPGQSYHVGPVGPVHNGWSHHRLPFWDRAPEYPEEGLLIYGSPGVTVLSPVAKQSSLTHALMYLVDKDIISIGLIGTELLQAKHVSLRSDVSL